MDAIAKMPTYEAYKDSGVEWLGSVPMGWELSRLGGYFTERRSKVSDVDYPPLSVTKNGVVPQLDNAAKTKDGDNRKLVKAGDFVINSRSDRKGSSGVSHLDGSVSLINIVLEPKRIHPKYCHHLLKSYIFIEEYYRVGRGIVADLWTTRYDEMRTITLAIPSMEEQTLIANFLDQKTAQIDEAIAIKEQQIALLKERKQIIIQKAVTQGLNPDVPMKDSGVDWIGGIPEHWKIEKVKFVSNFITSGPRGWSDYFTEEGAIFLQSGDLDESMGMSFDTSVRVSPPANAEGLRTRLLEHDVLVCITGAKTGKVSLASLNGSEVYINQHLCLIRPLSTINSEYLALVLHSGLGKTYFYLQQYGLKEGLGLSDVKNALLTFPPLKEQIDIVTFVKSESNRYTDLVQLQINQITKLKEYKTTLINSAVTGKIRITPEMVA